MSARLIRDGAIVEDEWIEVPDADGLPAGRPVIVSLERWRTQRDALCTHDAPLGVRLPNTVDADTLADDLPRWALIALEFPKFTDGRAYSQARVLRERLGFAGEIRATGEVLRDQLFYMQRCGINAFDLAEGRDLDSALAGLRDFSLAYQAAADTPQTIFRRRAAAS